MDLEWCYGGGDNTHHWPRVDSPPTFRPRMSADESCVVFSVWCTRCGRPALVKMILATQEILIRVL